MRQVFIRHAEEDAGEYFYLLGEKADRSIVVNVASGDARLLREYIEEMAGVLDENCEDRLFQYELGKSENMRLNGIYPNVDRLREITGYIPKISFSEGIKKIWIYRESQQTG